MSLHTIPAPEVGTRASWRWTPVRLTVAAAVVQTVLAVALTLPGWSYGKLGRTKFVSDVTLYRQYADRLLAGEIPYRDFVVEYPPLALPLFVLPRLAAGTHSGYALAFAVEMALCQAAALVLGAIWLARRGDGARVGSRLGFGVAAFLVLCPLAVSRYDPAPALLALAAALAWASGRSGAGGLLAGLGVLMKIYPGVLAAPVLGSPKRLRSLTVLAGVVGVGVAVCLGLGSGGEAGRSLRYHLDRGLEIESLWSGWLMLAGKAAGWRIASAYRFTSIELDAPGAAIASRLAFPMQAAALLVVAWRAWRTRLARPLTLGASAVLAFMLFGKVFSPQYLVWLVPLVLVLEGRAGDRSQWAFLLACGLTTLIYPWAIERLVWLDPAAVLLLNARNGVLLALWLAWTFGRRE